MFGYDSIEGYMLLLKLFISASTSLHRRRLPDDAQVGMAAGTTQHHIVSNAVTMAIHSL